MSDSVFFLALGFVSFLALVLVIVLGAYLFYVRISQHLYTEKRFNFVALWVCAFLMLTLLEYIFGVSPWVVFYSYFGAEISHPDIWDKILATIAVLAFVVVIVQWAKTWNGLWTKEGYDARHDGGPGSFLFDGFRETIRWMARRPPLPLQVEATSTPTPIALRRSLPPLEFRQIVRDLVRDWRREYVIGPNDWVDAAQCWTGVDSSLSRPIIVVCTLDETGLDIDRVRQQIDHMGGDRVHTIVVLEKMLDRRVAEGLCSDVSVDRELYDLDELITRALPLAWYKESIRAEFEEKELPNAPVTLADVIVETNVSDDRQDRRSSDEPRSVTKLDDYVSAWVTEGGMRQVALLGDYGQGKSTAALQLTHRMLSDPAFASATAHRIPILVRLTGRSPKATTPRDLLGAWGTEYGLGGNALLALHRAGRTVLILDAFDEITDAASEGDRINHFATLWQFACSDSKVIFTGRPNFFPDTDERRRVLSIAEEVASGPHCTAIYIQPFSDDQIRRSLRTLPDARARDLEDAIKRRPQLETIARRPSLLFQLSQLWLNGRIELEGEGPESAVIIQQFVAYSLERQLLKQRGDVATEERPFIPLRASELEYFTAGCAVAALEEGRNNSLPEMVFRQTIKNLWEAMGSGERFKRRAAETDALAMNIRERFEGDPDPVNACIQLVRTHGVVETDATRNSGYKFSHKSFAEALAATVIVSAVRGASDDMALVWRMTRPTGLLRQPAILGFCRELAATAQETGVEVTEYAAFANLFGVTDGRMARGIYGAQRLLTVIRSWAEARTAVRVFFGMAIRGFREGRRERGAIVTAAAVVLGVFSMTVLTIDVETFGEGRQKVALLLLLAVGVAWPWVLLWLEDRVMKRYFGYEPNLIVFFCYLMANPHYARVTGRSRRVAYFEEALRKHLRL